MPRTRGLAITADVARELVSRSMTVVAGLAVGIDTAAHRATLAAGGRTVAVIGTGINKVYLGLGLAKAGRDRLFARGNARIPASHAMVFHRFASTGPPSASARMVLMV